MSKEAFKSFVKSNPGLIKYVNNNSMTWQKFYEMFELYGTDNEVWNNYINNDLVGTSLTSVTAFKELMNMVRKINLEKVQKGVESLQKTINLIQELGGGGNSAPTYEKTPTFQHFDD